MVGQVNAVSGLSANPMLRRTNRIRTIYSSLAIEQNSLSLEQVTAVLDGKRVLAPPKDIAEVKNAYEIYEMLDLLDPYSVDHLLDAHSVLTRGLTEESGCFRSGPVGVVDKDGRVLHFGTLPAYAPGLTMELLDWVRNSEHHMLIKGCVFHYELELVHPFADGNGRTGRLVLNLMLMQNGYPPINVKYSDRKRYNDSFDSYYRDNNPDALFEIVKIAIREHLVKYLEIIDSAL